MRENKDDLELVRTVVLARHGARSTLCYLEELGKYFHVKFIDFFNVNYLIRFSLKKS